jgi:hypothetical protein
MCKRRRHFEYSAAVASVPFAPAAPTVRLFLLHQLHRQFICTFRPLLFILHQLHRQFICTFRPLLFTQMFSWAVYLASFVS